MVYPHKLLAAVFAAVFTALASVPTQAGDTTSEIINEPTLQVSHALSATSIEHTEKAHATQGGATLPVTDASQFAIETIPKPLATTLDNSLSLIGIRYKRGGQSPLTGFDCSGFVGHVFQGMGLTLPHSAKEISKAGETVAREELKPGDLVFFNTLRRAFSHVGIYLGGDLFIHSPRTGKKVKIDDMTKKYWVKAYNGARRLTQTASPAPSPQANHNP